VEQKDELMQDSISSGIDLAPLKPEVKMPLGINVAHEQHSEYGGSFEDGSQE